MDERLDWPSKALFLHRFVKVSKVRANILAIV